MDEKKDIFESEKWKKLKMQYRIAILEYCNSFNKTQSYMKAYPKGKKSSANKNAAVLFDRQDVKEVLQQAIDQLWSEEEKELKASIGKRFKKLGFSDIGDYVKFKNYKSDHFEIIDSDKVDTTAIAQVEFIENEDKQSRIKFKLHDPVKALSELAKIAGIVQEQEAPKDVKIYIHPAELKCIT